MKCKMKDIYLSFSYILILSGILFRNQISGCVKVKNLYQAEQKENHKKNALPDNNNRE